MASVELLEDRRLLSAGQLDTSFGAGGQVLLPSAGTIRASAMQSDGKAVLVGQTAFSNSSFLIERVTADGALDATFGTNGVVTTSFSDSAIAKAVAIESDGKIIVGGGDDLARYNADGSLDTTFGTGGKLTVAPSADVNIQALALTSDNSIVVVGRTTFQDPAHPSDSHYTLNSFTVAKFTPAGALDTSFNSTGTYIEQVDNSDNSVTISSGGSSNPMGIAVQPDGKVLVGGNYKIDPAVWRFNTDGSLDTTFGHGGMAFIPMWFSDTSGDDYDAATISQLIVQPDGRILAGGFNNYEDVPENSFAVMRFNADGSVDTTFGNTKDAPGGGFFNVPYNAGVLGVSDALLLQPDGQIIIGGNDGNLTDEIFRLTSKGAVDSTFNFAPFNFGNGYDSTDTSLDLTPDGNILLVDNPEVNGPTYLGLARIVDNYISSTTFPAATTTVNVSAGGINPTFGQGGVIQVNDPTSVWTQAAAQRTMRATAVQSDGKILIAGSIGTVATNGIGEIFVERLNTDGTVDTTFGADGIVETAIGNVSIANTIAIQSDDKIVIGGVSEDSATSPTDAEFALVRYTAAGALDTMFGTGGIVTTDFTGNEQIDSMVVGSGNVITVAGSYFSSPDNGFHVARYLSSGALDTSFNSTGKLTFDLGTPVSGSPAYPTSLALQPDGKILIGSRNGTLAAIYRYNANGSADTGFGTSGVATAIANNGASDLSTLAIAVLSSGKIVAAVGDLTIEEFSSAGVADSSFGNGGFASFYYVNNTYNEAPQIPLDPTFPTFLGVNLLVSQSDGGIVVVGSQGADDQSYPVGIMPLVAKLTSMGAIDSSFQTTVDPNFVPRQYYRGEVVRAAAVAPDGSIILAADAYSNTVSAGQTPASSPHWIGVTDYITQPTSYSITTPGGGVNYTPTNSGGGGGGSGNPLPPGQLTATITNTLPKRVMGGARGFIQVLVKNTGSTTFPGPISVQVYESTDSVLSTDDTSLTTLTLSNLSIKPGQTRLIRVPFNYASTLATGSYDILASVIETNAGTATYSTAAKRAVKITEPSGDLSLSIVPPGNVTLKTGKKAKMVFNIKNVGNATSVGTADVVLYESSDDAALQDSELVQRTLKGFRLGKNMNRRVTLDYIPTNEFGSSFYLKAVLGSATTPPDPNTNGNNVVTVRATIS